MSDSPSDVQGGAGGSQRSADRAILKYAKKNGINLANHRDAVVRNVLRIAKDRKSRDKRAVLHACEIILNRTDPVQQANLNVGQPVNVAIVLANAPDQAGADSFKVLLSGGNGGGA